MKVFLQTIIAISFCLLKSAHADCATDCSAAYSDSTLTDLCVAFCTDHPELFDADFPYMFGPLSIQPYAELTNSDPEELKDLTGELWARISADRLRMQFYFTMDSNPSPFFPYFGMHLHAGNLVAGEIGGHILASIAGQGDLIGCAAPNIATGELDVCSELCTPGSEANGNCVNPNTTGLPCPVCNLVFGGAYFCKGGCQGDNRILGNTTNGPNGPSVQSVVPSRFCDIGGDNPSNPRQSTWIPGRHSVEFSGNPEDGDEYSPYSIGVDENFDLWCGEELPFLYDLILKDGAASYVALHGDFNATGFASLAFGDTFAAVSTSEGGPQNCTIFGSAEYPCVEGVPAALPAINEPPPMDPIDCDMECSAEYTDQVLKDLCVTFCTDHPELFDAEFPYMFGPLSIQPYAELTNSDPEELKELTGELWARISADRLRMQFYFTMDSNPSPFFPYFGMHLHAGNLVAGEIGGHILASIAGQGDLIGCAAPDMTTGDLDVCSELCTPGSEANGNCVNPNTLGLPCPVCNLVFGGAYFCKGGCQGDNRILGNTTNGPNGPSVQSVVPSRFCDIGGDNPSNPRQSTWIPGRHSVEFSGNPEDGDEYSPYSIGVDENFDLWCGEELPFLYDLILKDGAASYVALHGDFNATGFASLAFGDTFAAVSTSEGGPQNCTIFGSAEYPCVEGVPGALPAINEPPPMDPIDCDMECSAEYTDQVLKDLCVTFCTDHPELFDAEFPYMFGPLTIQPYAELTNSDPEELKDLTGELWARISADRLRMQFYFTMDSNPSPFFPYFGMHLHAGNLVAGEIGGHILASIAGQGDLIGCAAPDMTTGDLDVCSELCTPGSEANGNCVNPNTLGLPCPVCNLVFGGAYFCKGGCQGDNRILGNTTNGPNGPSVQSVVPSRFCDIGGDNPSNPRQSTWIPGRHSVEFSGNPEDGDEYSPYSIGVDENFDLWCGEELPFLYDLILKDGAASYVALHGDFNATGFASLAFGDTFAAVSTSEGGPQNCTIFGSDMYPCVEGVPGALSAINASPMSPPTLAPTMSMGNGGAMPTTSPSSPTQTSMPTAAPSAAFNMGPASFVPGSMMALLVYSFMFILV